jgi:catechol 2,3-dioxygenase-like lactoylglutathione lyase family enzyme
MRIWITSVFVDDQAKARSFYTETLGFVIKHDIPMGENSWLTLTAPDAPDGPELLLEPNNNPVLNGLVQTYQKALVDASIPAAMFSVDDVTTEVARLKGLGVTFRKGPAETHGVTYAVFEDTCGNLIQIISGNQ